MFQLLRLNVKSNVIMIIIRVKFAKIRSGMGGYRSTVLTEN
jgi:hypothetical protein